MVPIYRLLRYNMTNEFRNYPTSLCPGSESGVSIRTVFLEDLFQVGDFPFSENRILTDHPPTGSNTLPVKGRSL